MWEVDWFNSKYDILQSDVFNRKEVIGLINAGSRYKIFSKLWKSLKGWVSEKIGLAFKLDLLDEYTLPRCMSNDFFEEIHFDTEQAYLMIASEGTGELKYNLKYIKEPPKVPRFKNETIIKYHIYYRFYYAC